MGTITDVQRIEYENKVKHAYQSAGSMLENTVRVQNIAGAGKYNFRKFGKLDMVERGQTRSMLEAQATDNSLVECEATNFVLPVLTDMFDQARTNAPQEQQEAAVAQAMAMKRKRDSSVIAALDAASMATNHTITCSSGLTIEKLADGLELFDANEIRQNDVLGDGQIHMLITEKQHKSLLLEAETQSVDTSNFRSLVHGKVGEFMGYTFHLIGTGRGALGLTKTSTVRACYAYVKSAIGQCVNVEPRVETSYQDLYTSYLTNALLAVGSVVIDNQGVVKFNVTES